MFAGSETPSFARVAFVAPGPALLDRVLPRLYPFEEPDRRTEIAVNFIDFSNHLPNGSKGPWF